MPIAQEKFYIPDDIAIGLATGQLKRFFGGVVRHATGKNKGRIAKLLEPVTMTEKDASKGIIQSVSKLVGEHKKLTFGAIVAVAGAIYYAKHKESKVVRIFRRSLKQYLDCVKNGDLDITRIQELMDALDAMKRQKNYENICVRLTAEELGELVNHIYEYTLKIAGNNGAIISDTELLVPENQFDTIVVKLQKCLETQKHIFDEAA